MDPLFCFVLCWQMLISYFFLWFGLLSKYSYTAAFENNVLLTISVSLSTNFMKSESSGSLLCFCLIVSTFLDHLFLALSHNFVTAYTCLVHQKHSNFVDVQYFQILSEGFEDFGMLQHFLIWSVATA